MDKAVVKDALILTIITLCAGVLLGIVHEITLEPIAQANYKAQQEAYKAVFADAASFEDVADFDAEAASQATATAHTDLFDGLNIALNGLVEAKDASGETLGYIVDVTDSDGYAGDITFSVGIQLDGTLDGYSITDISETAGLGMKAKEEKFYSQFENKQVQSFTVVKQKPADDTEIEAISGATITSRAMTNGVNFALAYFQDNLGGEK